VVGEDPYDVRESRVKDLPFGEWRATIRPDVLDAVGRPRKRNLNIQPTCRAWPGAQRRAVRV
jgi:hypothetical protein